MVDETVLGHATLANESTTFKTPGTKANYNESNIVVGVRVRPSRDGEDCGCVLDIDDNQVVVASEKVYKFDLMFDGNVGQVCNVNF